MKDGPRGACSLVMVLLHAILDILIGVLGAKLNQAPVAEAGLQVLSRLEAERLWRGSGCDAT